jgi:hypothetical protein
VFGIKGKVLGRLACPACAAFDDVFQHLSIARPDQTQKTNLLNRLDMCAGLIGRAFRARELALAKLALQTIAQK